MQLNRNDKEFYYSIDRAIWEAVGKTHATLSKNERKLIIRQLEAALDRYELEVLRVYPVRVYLYRLYNDKINTERAVSTF